jgi:hypothetical protein
MKTFSTPFRQTVWPFPYRGVYDAPSAQWKNFLTGLRPPENTSCRDSTKGVLCFVFFDLYF